MQKSIKKIFSLIFVIVFSMMLLVACTEDKPKEDGWQKVGGTCP